LGGHDDVNSTWQAEAILSLAFFLMPTATCPFPIDLQKKQYYSAAATSTLTAPLIMFKDN
jgi:hypothetical protein